MWPALGQAVWALPTGRDFAEVPPPVIDLAGDPDTVACADSGPVGAVYGV